MCTLNDFDSQHRILDLSNNSFKQIESNAFLGLRNLETLNLFSNQLENIDNFQLLDLNHLDLSNNHFFKIK